MCPRVPTSHLVKRNRQQTMQWARLLLGDSRATPSHRVEVDEQSIKIVEQIKAKLDAYAVDMSIPNNNFRAAIKHTANQWPALSECLKHGHTRLDTNLLESKFRPAMSEPRIGCSSASPKQRKRTPSFIRCCRPAPFIASILTTPSVMS